MLYCPLNLSLWAEVYILEEQTKRLNPWFSIWLQPRATMREVLAHPRSPQMMWGLAVLGGFVTAYSSARSNAIGLDGPLFTVWMIIVLHTLLNAMIYMYILPPITRFFYRFNGGIGDTEATRQAILWGQIPWISCILIWIPDLLMHGEAVFQTRAEMINPTLLVLEFIVQTWAMIVALKCLGEAHGLSFWQSLVAQIIPFLLLLFVGFFLTMLFGFLLAALTF